MRYQVIYDKPGRLRIRMGSGIFDKEHGYGIEALILSNPSVLSAEASPANGGLLIQYRPEGRQQLLALIDGLNWGNIPDSKPLDINQMRELDNIFARSLAVIFCKNFLKRTFAPAPLRVLLTISQAIHYWRKGFQALQSGKINVDVLDAAAVSTAVGRGDFKTAASIMMLLRISELLEEYSRKRARQSLAQSLALNIDGAWLIRNGEPVLTPVSQIQIGDHIQIHAGTVIPLDGEVCEGEALVNESSMTGEPYGVLRCAGNSVFAGTVLEEGSLEIKVRTFAGDTRIQKIISLINHSENLKAAIQSKAERLADAIVPFSFLAAAGTLLLTGSLRRATSVLMVDYSCAIKLTTPICIISAMHEAARHRILVKGGKYLEAYANADTIVFDKTGTLTAACPRVAKVIPFGGRTRQEVLRVSACLEEHFPHSVAKAIVRQAEVENLGHREEHAKPEYIVAHGISSTLHGNRVLIGSLHFIAGDEGIEITEEAKAAIESELGGFSPVFLAIGGEMAGMICIDDPVRPEAKEVLEELRDLGIKQMIMLTGDSEAAARHACAEAGIAQYYASVLPEGKAEIISRLREQGHTVIMVGDGINDSPALAQADVSVAMKDGSDIAKEVADISLLAENLHGLVTLRRLSQGLLRHIHTNYRSIVGFNTSLLVLGATGLIQPSTLAVMHNASTMLLCGLSMKGQLPPAKP